MLGAKRAANAAGSPDGPKLELFAREHLSTFAAHQGNRADDSRGAPWPVAIETARLLGLAVRELDALRADFRRLEASHAALLSALEARRRPRQRVTRP